MKIINLETFLKLPPGTICMKYEPCNFGSIFSKGETLPNDYVLEYLTDEIKANSSKQVMDKLLDAEDNGTSLEMDFDMSMRDGLFEDEQLFAMYEKQDVEGLIDKLQHCLKAYTNNN